jgi:membrane protein DedA with SNARE-associated domain
MLEWVDQLISTAMTAITSGSPWAIITLFLVVALTECGVPFPFVLDSVLFFTSYQAGVDIWHILFVIFIVFLGREFGASIIYWLTRLLGNAVIYWFSKRYKHLQENWAQLTVKLSSQAPMAIAMVRITGLMTVASMVSGAMKIRYTQFFFGIALSALIFDGALIILGLITKFGFSFIDFTPSVWHVAVGLIVIMVLIMLISRLVSKRRSRKKDKENIAIAESNKSVSSGNGGNDADN